MKTTWTLDLKTAKAVRDARALRRELQSLQGMAEQVDGAMARLNSTLGRTVAPAMVTRRVRAENAVTRSVRATYDTHRVGHRRVSQDEQTQARIRRAVDTAQRGSRARAGREQARVDARNLRSATEEHAFRKRTADWMLRGYERQRAASARAARAAGREDMRNRRSGRASLGQAAGVTAGVTLGIVGATLGAAGTFASMAATAAQMTLSIGESVLQMIAFREASLTTLRTMAGGNAAVAREQYQFAQQFARQTPLDVQQVLALQSQVSTAGFTGGQNREVLLGAADVGAANAGDSTAASRYVRAISQIRNAGRVRAQEMNQLGEVGIGRRDMLLALGRQANVRRGTGETDQAFLTRLGQMQEGGRFTGEQGVAAAQDVVRRRFNNGGALGGFARGQGESLFGTLSNLRGAVFDLITSIDQIENTPGVRALKTVLNGIASTLSGANATGKRLQGIVATIINDVGMLVGGNLADFDATLNGALDAGKEFLPIVRDVVRAFGSGALGQARREMAGLGTSFKNTFGNRAAVMVAGELGRNMVTLFAYGARLTAQFAGLLGIVTSIAARWADTGRVMQDVAGLGRVLTATAAPQPVSRVDQFRAVVLNDRAAQQRVAMSEIGRQAGEGLRQGLLSTQPGLERDVRSLTDTIPATSRSALKVASPSRVMADEVGRYIPEGIALGINRGRSPLDRAMGDLIPMPSVPGFGPGSFGGLGGASIGPVTIVVGAGANEETGRAAARGFVDELASLLEVPALAG